MKNESIKHRIEVAISNVDIVLNDLKGIEFDDFVKHDLLARASSFSVQQICEHLTQLKPVLENVYPFIEWNRIRGMRNVLVHEYCSINFEILFKTIKEDLPVLRKQLNEVLDSIKSNHLN